MTDNPQLIYDFFNQSDILANEIQSGKYSSPDDLAKHLVSTFENDGITNTQSYQIVANIGNELFDALSKAV